MAKRKTVIRYFLEAMPLIALWHVMRWLPIGWASEMMGILARSIGPLLGMNRKALRNLRRVYPDMEEEERRQTARAMWDNIGRVFGESAHHPVFREVGRKIHNRELLTDQEPQISLIGIDAVKKLQAQNRPILVAGMHAANWEMVPAILWENDLPLVTVYRPLNNKMLDRFLRKKIRDHVAPDFVAKGSQAARGVIGALKSGRAVGWLVDQRETEGMTHDFLGNEARTSIAPAKIAIKTNAVIVPLQCVRLPQAEELSPPKFMIKLHEPIDPKNYEGNHIAEDVMLDLYNHFATWIKENPSQWLWPHRRWKI